jgi:esterase/lipase superfamily enzyme
MKTPHTIITLALLIILQAPSTLGQSTSLTITGRVTDPYGEGVPGATVTATNIETGVERSTRADVEGTYTFTGVEPGIYRLRVEMMGFNSLIRTIEVRPGSAARFDLALEIGGVTEEVTVTAGGPTEDKKEAPQKNYATVKVFYATDRKMRSCKTPQDCYGDESSETLSYGSCEVSIPRDHRMGRLEAPTVFKLQFRNDPEKHVVLLKVSQENHRDFFREVSRRIDKSQSRSAFVFIHGFNVTFEDAARRTAQISYDLGFDGAPIFYSWPSKGSVLSYSADEATVDTTVTHLKGFLEDVATRTGATTVHLIAHSMGNRALIRALKEIGSEQRSTPLPRFHQVVLAAPDIDARLFRDLAGAMKRPVDHVTLYASSNDKALRISKSKHEYARAGESGSGLVIVPGVYTLDVSELETDFLGHSYFGDNKTVLFDLFRLFKERRQPPDQRCGIRARQQGSSTYWAFDRTLAASCHHN